MRMPVVSIRRNAFAVTLMLAGAWLSTLVAMAQSAGNNAVYNSSGLSGSSAFIDASVLAGSDVCAQIHSALGIIVSQSLVGAVIDARGIATGLTCTSGTPWVNGTTYNVPSVILLPATPATSPITISTTWVLPPQTRLVGVGMRDSGTKILAGSTGASPMIQFCSSSCSGVSLAGVFLDGGGFPITEIENDHAGALSYVDHVNLSNFGSSGIGLYVTASGSGPYSNLSCGSTAASNECVELMASNTGGLHSITCTAKPGSSDAAILLDGSNNTIEDIHVEGFEDGVLVGSNAMAESNILSNVNGTGGAGPMTNVIEISTASNTYPVNDLAVLSAGALSEGSGHEVTNLIKDNVIVATLPNVTGTTGSSALAEYVLGGQTRVPRATHAFRHLLHFPP